jgi:hypothetical protein
MLAICASVDAIHEGHQAIRLAVESGEISPKRLHDSVERILTLKSSLPVRRSCDEGRLNELSDRIKNLNDHLN